MNDFRWILFCAEMVHSPFKTYFKLFETINLSYYVDTFTQPSDYVSLMGLLYNLRITLENIGKYLAILSPD